jgi:hypothetical protein
LLTLPATDRSLRQRSSQIGTYGALSQRCLWPLGEVCPGNRRSAGKQRSGAVTKGNTQLKTILCEIAATIARSPGTSLHYLQGCSHRLARRRGKPRAMLAVAHSLLVSSYYLLRDQVPYQDLGPEHFDHLHAQRLERHYVRRLEGLGFAVRLTPAS